MRTNYLLSIFFAVTIVASSCITTKKAPPLPNEPDFVEVVEVEDSLVFEAFEFDIADTINPIFLLASIERQKCYGDCPEYTAEFYSNGRIIFKGHKNVDKLGDYEALIDTPTVNKIKILAERIGYFDLAEFYPTYGQVIDDLPATMTHVNFIFKNNSVTNTHGSPVRLHKFERYLDEILSLQKWKPIGQR